MFNDTLDLKHEIMRKLIHLASLLTIPIIIFWGTTVAISLIAFATLGYLGIEYGRLKLGWQWIGTSIVENTAREDEKHKLIVAPLSMALGIGLTIMLYAELPIVYSAICAAGLGDACAAVGGKILKNPKRVAKGHKSYIGAGSCFLVSFLCALGFTGSFLLAIACGIVATVVELLPLGPWDNTLIPIAVGATMQLLATLVL